MRHERPGQGPARDRLHHRRLDLEKPAFRIFQEPADRGEHPGARFEHRARPRIDDQVQVAPPISGLDVGQTVPFLGQRQMALGQELEPVGPTPSARRSGCGRGVLRPRRGRRCRATPRPPKSPSDRRILPHVDLYALPAVGDHQEPGLPEAPHDQDPTRRRGADLRALEIGAAGRPVGVHQRRQPYPHPGPGPRRERRGGRRARPGRRARRGSRGAARADRFLENRPWPGNLRRTRGSGRRRVGPPRGPGRAGSAPRPAPPFTKRGDGSSLNVRASSIASSITTAAGVSATSNSYTANLRTSRSMTAMRERRQLSEADSMSGSICSIASSVPRSRRSANCRGPSGAGRSRQ